LFDDGTDENRLFGEEGQLRAARAEDHRFKPPEGSPTMVALNQRFSRDEMERIRFGFAPPDMDYKWFMYYDAGTLHIHRSWTGVCVYRVEFAEEAGGMATATEAAVYPPSGASMAKPKSGKTARAEILWLIRTHLIEGVFDGWDSLS
jgi:hypothetical protein